MLATFKIKHLKSNGMHEKESVRRENAVSRDHFIPRDAKQ